MSESIKKSFHFHIPVELVKAKKEEGEEVEWKIAGIASTADEDLQGETVDQNGMDISMLKAGRGLFNFDHQKGPENIVGQIEDADFVSHEGRRALLVKGYLFKHSERGKAFYNILRSLKKGNGPRVHMSIEGKILERDIRNPKSINKARIEKVALTLDPVNPYTFTELVKSLNAQNSSTPDNTQTVEKSEEKQQVLQLEVEDVEILVETAEKALAAGAGYTGSPTSMTGGEPMTKESLESRVKRVTYGKKREKNQKAMVKSVIDSARKAYPDHDPLLLAEWVIEAFLNRKK